MGSDTSAIAWAGTAIVFAAALAVALLIQVFFLLNLREALRRVRDENRAMPADYVWFNFIPVFGLGWFIYMVIKVRDSLRAEYRSRGWPGEGDFGYSMGLAAGVLAIVSTIWAWVPQEVFLAGLVLAAGQVICWIVYWVKIARVKARLGPSATILGAGPVPPPGTAGPERKTRHCARCGTVVTSADRFCWFCGSPLP